MGITFIKAILQMGKPRHSMLNNLAQDFYYFATQYQYHAQIMPFLCLSFFICSMGITHFLKCTLDNMFCK